jgi:hypothetical protein
VNLKFQLDDLRVFCLAARKASHSAKVRVCVRFLQEQLARGPFALKQ